MKPEYFMYRSLLGLSVCDATGEKLNLNRKNKIIKT